MTPVNSATSRTPRKSWAIVLLLLGATLGLAGCAPPSSAEVEERFLVEYAVALGYPVEIVDGNAVMEQLAQQVAEAAASGACGEEDYYATLEADVEYAFGVTCSVYYESQMSAERIEWVKREVVERSIDGPSSREVDSELTRCLKASTVSHSFRHSHRQHTDDN